MAPRGHEKNEKMREEAMNKISNAALQVFSDFGYHGTSMKKIAKTAGLSYGLVYHYYTSKEDVFKSLVDIALEKSISTIREGLSIEGTAWDKLKNLSKVLIENITKKESSRYFLIMIQAITQAKSLPGLMEYIGEHSETHYSTVMPIIIEAQRSGDVVNEDPVALTAAYLSFVQGLSYLVFGGTGLESKITPDVLLNLLRKRNN